MQIFKGEGFLFFGLIDPRSLIKHVFTILQEANKVFSGALDGTIISCDLTGDQSKQTKNSCKTIANNI